jgi:predicted RNA binding protein YcfA (HicA-like mRNA interferase family)
LSPVAKSSIARARVVGSIGGCSTAGSHDPVRQTLSAIVIRDFGFVEIRVRGSHRSYKHPDAATLLVIQPHGADAKPYQQKQFLDMIEEYGLERPER